MTKLTYLLTSLMLIALWQCSGPVPVEGDSCNNTPRDQVVCEDNQFILYCDQGKYKPVDFEFVPAEDGCTYVCSQPFGQATYDLDCP